jgi:poly(A) polymerase/tRNA nucleotidyltransferase (CCA-adding enzyme)
MLDAPVPSVGLRLAEATGVLAAFAPDLAAQRGIPQNKVPGEDLWDHTLRTVDAAPAGAGPIRLAALVHDLGKPSTLADGHFHHHEVVGARLAEAWLRRLRFPRAQIDEVVLLVRHHMFEAGPALSDAAMRRFLRRVGPEHVDALLALRRADDIGSGLPPDDAALAAFKARVDGMLAARVPLDRTALAVDGDDLMRELGLAPGPGLGRVLDELLERVLTDPSLNDRMTLIRLAHGILGEMDSAGGDA